MRSSQRRSDAVVNMDAVGAMSNRAHFLRLLNGESGKARVPNIAIFATAKRLIRPTYTEGFAQLFSVQACDDFTFAVSDWQEQDTKGSSE